MKVSRGRRSVFWLVALPAVMMPTAMGTADPFLPVMLGALIVILVWWGSGEKVSLRDGLLLGVAAALVGPVLWVLLNIVVFTAEYMGTAAELFLRGQAGTPEARDFLAFLRVEFTTAVSRRVLPLIAPAAMRVVLFLAIPSAIGGALASMATRASAMQPVRHMLDYLLLWRTEREEDEFDRAARDHPELLGRAGELRERGFAESEARRLALAEFRDPILNPPGKGSVEPRAPHQPGT